MLAIVVVMTSGCAPEGPQVVESLEEVSRGAVAETEIDWAGGVVEVGRDSFRIFSDADVYFDSELSWTTAEAINNGGCTSAYDTEAVAAHEIGHVLGLAHSCDQGDECDDPAFEESTMYWEMRPCDVSMEALTEDDEAGLRYLYGPRVAMDCATSFLGAAPYTLSCGGRTSRAGTPSLTWTFGEGEPTSGDTASHTYESVGRYMMHVCMHAETERCTGLDVCDDQEVVVCGAPAPTLTSTWQKGLGLFVVADLHVDPECVDEWTWVVTAADGTPLPSTALDRDTSGSVSAVVPEAGTYLVRLDASGIAGAGVAELPVDVGIPAPAEGGGCGGGGAAWALPWVMFGVRRGRAAAGKRVHGGRGD